MHGPEKQAISVEGPIKAEIDFKDRKDGSFYKVSEPGEYRIYYNLMIGIFLIPLLKFILLQ